MIQYRRVYGMLMLALLLTACATPAFNGSRQGNDSKLFMEYTVFNTTYSQALKLKTGDVLQADIINESGKLSIVIQKAGEDPIYESIDTPTGSFRVNIEESGTYNVTVIGVHAKGSLDICKNSDAQ